MGWFRWRPWMLCFRATSVAFGFGFLVLLLSYGTQSRGVPEIIGRAARTRQLLREPGDGGTVATMQTGLEACSASDVVVYQGATAPLPNGIPTYTVEILNVCESGCAVGDIHVRCGWFSSARLVNPRVFRRLRFDDCLVNDGAALAPGQSLSFQYANTYRYPLAISSLACV